MKDTFKLFLILYLVIPVYANCQSILQYTVDSIRSEIMYDIEHIKYMEISVDNNGVKHTNYYTRGGDTISLFDWRIKVSVIERIKEQILRNFIIDEFTEAQGNAVLLLILDFKKEVYEIRIIRGITQGFNKELLRVIKKIESELIFVHSTECKISIVTPFAIRLY